MRTTWIILIGVLPMALVASAVGQATVPATAPAQAAWRVWLPENSATGLKLRLIGDAVAGREFDRAARMAVEVFAEAEGGPLPEPPGGPEQLPRHVDARRVLERQMSRWPDEALRAYANRASAAAASRLQAAGRDTALRRAVLDEFLYTDSGMECGQALLAEDLEAGRFAQVLRTAQRLLLRPLPDDVAARAMLYLALGQQGMGLDHEARATLARLKRDFPGAALRVRGEQVAAAGIDGSILQPLTAVAEPPRFPAAMAWSRDLGELPNVGRDERDRRRAADWMNQLGADGVLLGVGAASDGQVLVVNRGHEIAAMRLSDGSTPPEWLAWHPPDGILRGPVPESLRWLQRLQYAGAIGPHHCLAMGEGVALAVTGSGMSLPTDQGRAAIQPRQTLHCIDVASGAVRWTSTPRQMVPEHMPQELYYSGRPIIDGGRGYLLMRGPNGAAGQECRLVCINLRDGRVLWTRVLGGAILQGTRLIVPEDEEAYVSDPALDGGRIYVATNLGVVSAVDAHSGRLAWVAAYPHQMHVAQRHPSPWRLPQNHNPTVVADGGVFSVPLDSQYVLAHDAETGAEILRLGRDQAAGPAMLLGAGEGVLLLAEGGRLRAVRYEGRVQTLWQAEVPPMRGRPWVAGGVMYVPTAKGFMMMEVRTGRPLQSASLPQQAGNVLMAGGRLLVVGDRHVSAWLLKEGAPAGQQP